MPGINVEVVGYIGATLTTSAFLPQTIKVIKTRDTQSISLTMYILFTAGVFFWLAYGVMIESVPVVVANLITIVFSSTILLLKIKEIARPRLADQHRQETDESET